jgi:CRP-like cAMP-binding protein
MFNRKPSESDSIIRAMRNCPIFEGLSKSELKTLLNITHIRDYSIDEKIFMEGTAGLCFYIVVKGSVDIVPELPSGANNLVLKTFNEGSYFSESHLFSEANHTVSGIAKEVTKLIIFAKPDFEDLIKIKPRLGNKLLMGFLAQMSNNIELLYKQNKKLLEQNSNRE